MRSCRNFSYSTSQSVTEFIRLSGDALTDDGPDDDADADVTDVVHAVGLTKAARVASNEFNNLAVLLSIWQSPVWILFYKEDEKIGIIIEFYIVYERQNVEMCVVIGMSQTTAVTVQK